ncbi:MAG: ABC transporter ATP-binding protein [Candidatus Omnitrophota bacterium]
MAQVSLKNITKIYKGKKAKAANNVSLGIENREFMVLVGPSACGKSTTLRMIAGLEQITSGELYIANKLVNDVPAKDRNIAMVFQNYALYPHMNVFDNMAFGLKVRRYPKPEIVQRVKEAAKMLGIDNLLNSYPREISGGQRQRVALGRAVVRKPMVFLFDEPLSNLDAQLRTEMRVKLHKLHLRLASTMIYVTHDQVEAMTLGNRIAVMNKGVLQQVDNPTVVYDKPKNKFVAGFIGSPPMNFLRGKIIKKEGKFYFDEGRISVRIVEGMNTVISRYLDKDVTMGIRCEDIYDKLFVSDASPDNIVKVTCDVVESMGSEAYLYLNTGHHSFIARVGPQARPQIGQDMQVVFDMAKAHFFDNDSEETIV